MTESLIFFQLSKKVKRTLEFIDLLFEDIKDSSKEVKFGRKEGLKGITGEVLVVPDFTLVSLVQGYHLGRNGESTHFSKEPFKPYQSLFKEVEDFEKRKVL